MAYVINLGERRSERSASGTRATGWLTEVRRRKPVLIALIAAGLLSGGAVICQSVPHSPVMAREDPNSAQEIADDAGGFNAIAANGEVADDSQASRWASVR